MSVFKRGSVWWFKVIRDGKRYQRSSGVKNKNDAREIENAFRTELAKGKVGIVKKEEAPTVKEFAPDFIGYIEVKCADKPATVKFYGSKVGLLLKDKRLAGKRIDQITEKDVDEYAARRSKVASKRGTPMAPASINRELATLRRMLRLAAKRWKLIDHVPEIEMLGGEVTREFVFTKDQERLYLEAADQYPDLRDVAALLVETGIRVGEALKLDWANVHLDPVGKAAYGHLTVLRVTSKGNITRSVPLTDAAVEVLKKRHPAASGLVFHRANGKPLNQTHLDHQHEKLRRLLKLPEDAVIHSFRHTALTRLGLSGADAFTIMRIAGHSSIVISQRYVHPTSGAVDAAFTRREAWEREATFEATGGSGGSGNGTDKKPLTPLQ
jgi:integrase